MRIEHRDVYVPRLLKGDRTASRRSFKAESRSRFRCSLSEFTGQNPRPIAPGQSLGTVQGRNLEFPRDRNLLPVLVAEETAHDQQGLYAHTNQGKLFVHRFDYVRPPYRAPSTLIPGWSPQRETTLASPLIVEARGLHDQLITLPHVSASAPGWSQVSGNGVIYILEEPIAQAVRFFLDATPSHNMMSALTPNQAKLWLKAIEISAAVRKLLPTDTEKTLFALVKEMLIAHELHHVAARGVIPASVQVVGAGMGLPDRKSVAEQLMELSSELAIAAYLADHATGNHFQAARLFQIGYAIKTDWGMPSRHADLLLRDAYDLDGLLYLKDSSPARMKVKIAELAGTMSQVFENMDESLRTMAEVFTEVALQKKYEELRQKMLQEIQEQEHVSALEAEFRFWDRFWPNWAPKAKKRIEDAFVGTAPPPCAAIISGQIGLSAVQS